MDRAVGDAHPPVDAAADDEMFDMVNLTSKDTGVPGTVFVSTAMGRHGPRVKWFPERASRDGPCLIVTIEREPSVIVHGLSPVQARRGEAAVREWVCRNEAALLDFWWNGLGWTREEVNAFLDGLAKANPP